MPWTDAVHSVFVFVFLIFFVVLFFVSFCLFIYFFFDAVHFECLGRWSAFAHPSVFHSCSPSLVGAQGDGFR